jgi:predicted thioredoxin/glutaredoxin
MKKKILASIAAILLVLAGAYYFNQPTTIASAINTFDMSRIERIEITEVQGDITYTIDDKESVSEILEIISGDYKVKRMNVKQEIEHLITTPPRLVITAVAGEAEVLESFFVTQDNSIIVANSLSMIGNNRTELFKSVEDQTSKIGKLMNAIRE